MDPTQGKDGSAWLKPDTGRGRFFSALHQFALKRAAWVLATLFFVSLLGLFWHLSALSDNLVRKTLVGQAAEYSKAIEEVRTLYTQRVVQSAKVSEVEITHAPDALEGSLPLPATFSMELAERIGAKGNGTHVRLYSDYPFPWRENGGPRDDFERKALEALRQAPDEPFLQYETYDGRPSLRFATADRMRPSCIQCHNTHPDSPKTDWRSGDVRGVLEVIYPMDTVVADTQASLQQTFLLAVAVGSLGILVFAAVLKTLRETADQMKLANTDLEQANVDLEAQSHDLQRKQVELKQTMEHLDQKNDELAAANNAAELAHSLLKDHTSDLERARRAALNMMQDMDIAREQAQMASQSKSNFLANMSHEIRTPMTAILGYTELLEEPQLAAADRLNHIQTIRGNGKHLLTIINDILDLSKIEADKMTLEQISCSTTGLVSEVVSLLMPRVQEKGLSVCARYQSPVPETIRTDPTRLRQILLNLLGNAVKFTNEGGVELAIDLITDEETGKPLMKFDVIDSGIGMSAEQQDMLFKPFSQADNSMTRRFGGTGLGLVICQRLSRMLGGDISVQSIPGKGSTFTALVETGDLSGVTMIHPGATPVGDGQTPQPDHAVQPTPVAPAPENNQLPLEGARVLIAEDGLDNQRLVSFYLKKAGAEAAIANNGQEAYDQITQAIQDGKPFDVVLMDMQMPVLDGYGATAKLRAEGYRGPIIALTAHAMSGDRDKCIDAGCDDYTTKPIDRKVLVEMVSRYRSASQAQSSLSG